ncbi:MAG TPA: hypothetical protein PLI18_09070 [Pirellulaceae bacterium]|nr:hypothetical protein [Pirellulaceae bacterium]
MRAVRSIVLLLPTGLLVTLLIASLSGQDPTQAVPEGPAVRLREGSRLESATGWFRITADRTEFHASPGETKLICLENLALERIVDELEDGLTLIWQIDGRVTEYHGRNYLLVERAFVKSTLDR